MALRVKINPEKIPDRDQPLSIHKLSVTRAGVPVLRDISLELSHGEILGIVGECGSGKSTLVSVIAGTIDLPSENIEYHHALLDGNDLLDASAQNRYRRGIHCVFANRKLFGDLSVRENLEVALYKSSKKKAKSRIDDLVELFPKLKDLLNVKSSECTVGQQQIVAIARAIMEFPSVLVLDEPTLGLNPAAIEAVAQVLEVLVTGSVGVLVCERRESFINTVASRRLNLVNGKLAEPIAESTRATEWKPK